MLNLNSFLEKINAYLHSDLSVSIDEGGYQVTQKDLPHCVVVESVRLDDEIDTFLVTEITDSTITFYNSENEDGSPKLITVGENEPEKVAEAINAAVAEDEAEDEGKEDSPDEEYFPNYSIIIKRNL
jgi:uncharacterized protein YjdB